jgi:uncharacterized protein YdhG (YjbR/CyaY superfamily)
MATNFKDIDDYLSKAPTQTLDILKKLRSMVKKMVPEAEEAMSYQIPTFKVNGKNFIHFAGFENHVGVYPGPSDINDEIPGLKKHQSSKGTLKFPLSEAFPYDLIERLVKIKAKKLAN